MSGGIRISDICDYSFHFMSTNVVFASTKITHSNHHIQIQNIQTNNNNTL